MRRQRELAEEQRGIAAPALPSLGCLSRMKAKCCQSNSAAAKPEQASPAAVRFTQP
jgi:hypothetical protein